MQVSFEIIAEALASHGRYIGPSIMSASLNEALAARALSLHTQGLLRAARVGRNEHARNADEIRRDHTRWLDDEPSDDAEREAVARVGALREALNEQLFLGARRHELHFAHYAPGAFYSTHRDRFGNDDARLVSLVFYLNEAWPADAGGELVIYADRPEDAAREIEKVRPVRGTMVAFLSDRFPHEVRSAAQDRFSLTGWLRRDDVHV